MSGLNNKYKVISLHWGFGFGGVAKYASLLDCVEDSLPVNIFNLCILSEKKIVDENTLDSLKSVNRIYIRSVLDFRWFSESIKLINDIRPDVVMTHGFNAHFFAWLLRTRTNSNVKYIASYHGGYYGSSFVKKRLGYLYELFTNFYLRHYVTHIVAVAGVCKDYLSEKKISTRKITVVHNGIPDVKPDAKRTCEFRKAWKLDENQFAIGVVSRLEPIKGVDVLINAFHKAVNLCPNARLIIVGSGVQEVSLKNLVNSLGIKGRVIFAGYQTEVVEIINAFDLYVLPSRKEAHSIALLEAMRACKPIVATNAGGNTESVRDTIDALVVDIEDVDAMADAIWTIIRDKGLASRMALSARQRYLEHFTEEVMVQKTSRWFQDALNIK